jgi:hypothetical protein
MKDAVTEEKRIKKDGGFCTAQASYEPSVIPAHGESRLFTEQTPGKSVNFDGTIHC